MLGYLIFSHLLFESAPPPRRPVVYFIILVNVIYFFSIKPLYATAVTGGTISSDGF